MVVLYGHRGAKGEAPENTLTGFEYAHSIGVNAFELDVRLSADGCLIVLHDALLDRTTNGSGLASSFTSRHLAFLDARSDFPDWPEPASVPTIDEVLARYNDKQYLIEIKSDSPERLEKVCKLLLSILDTRQIRSRSIVTSFDPVALKLVVGMAPDQPCGYIGRYAGPAYLDEVTSLGCVQAHYSLDFGSYDDVSAAKARGLRVVGRPGNSFEELDRLMSWRVDAITSDYPSVALAYFHDRNIPLD